MVDRGSMGMGPGHALNCMGQKQALSRDADHSPFQMDKWGGALSAFS